MNWIACKQEMPPDRIRVLCFMRSGMIRILSYMPAHKGVAGRHIVQAEWHSDVVHSITCHFMVADVTHWMPLPDRPSDTASI